MNEQPPGRELPKEYREIAVELVRNQGRRYRYGKGHPTLDLVDKTQVPDRPDNPERPPLVQELRRRRPVARRDLAPKGSGRR